MSVVLGEGSGPLRGVRVVEIAGIGPGPHACMLLADLGADVLRVDRPGGPTLGVLPQRDLLARGRPSVVLDLKQPAAVRAVLDLVTRADVLVEGMRPGVAERLGLGPDRVLAANPALVYGRMTGWGQDGPWARTAGHDLTYLALSGVLHGLGQDPDRPHFPTNLLGDFGGGSAYLVVGVLAALLSARATGVGQVVDAAIVDGTAHLDAMGASLRAEGRVAGLIDGPRGSHALDGGLPWYRLYETADGRHLAVAALEPQFYAELVRLLELPEDAPGQDDPARYAELAELLAARVASRTLAEWTHLLDGSEACAVPVLTPEEAAAHPHLAARGTWVERDDELQPAPAPRFSGTPAALSTPPTRPGQDTREALSAWGVADVDDLLASGAAVQT